MIASILCISQNVVVCSFFTVILCLLSMYLHLKYELAGIKLRLPGLVALTIGNVILKNHNVQGQKKKKKKFRIFL